MKSILNVMYCVLLASCAPVATDTRKTPSQETAAASAPSQPTTVAASPAVESGEINGGNADNPSTHDERGIERVRYYGEGTEVILGRVVKWFIENDWQITNSGAGAGGVVVGKGKLRAIQRVVGSPDKGEKAEVLCADCGSTPRGQILANEGYLTVKVKTLDLGKTRVIVDFSAAVPPGSKGCQSTGKLEQIILNYLLKD